LFKGSAVQATNRGGLSQAQVEPSRADDQMLRIAISYSRFHFHFPRRIFTRQFCFFLIFPQNTFLYTPSFYTVANKHTLKFRFSIHNKQTVSETRLVGIGETTLFVSWGSGNESWRLFPVSERCGVDSSTLVFSLSSHRHSEIGFIFISLFILS
jgi:hypothetical protein